MQVTDSSRLSYRLLGADDAELFYQLDKDPEVMRYINGGKPHTLEDISKLAIPRLLAYTNHEKGHGMWGAFIKDTNEFIGWVLLRPMNFFSDTPEFNNLEIGWRLVKSAWGKGYGSEAAKQIINAAIAYGGIEAISAIAMPENKGSINIMKKIGLKYVKTYQHQDSQLGDTEVVYYQLSLT